MTVLRTSSPVQRARPSDVPDVNDYYLLFLCALLIGYALAGKGVAYLGFPPLHVGEIAFLLGIAAFLRTGCWIAVLTTAPSLLLTLLIVWVIFRTLPYIRYYGMDSLRDSVIVLYGFFAIIMAALLIEKPSRLGQILSGYSRFAWVYGILGGLIYQLTVPGLFFAHGTSSSFQFPQVRGGEAAVHLAGIAVFILLGFRRVGALWLCALLVSFVLVTPSRAAMLTCVIPIAIAVVVGGKFRSVAPGLALGLGLLGVASAFNIEIPMPTGRTAGPAQIVDNLYSLVGHSDAAGGLDNTKKWRLMWWQAIQDYTFRGDYFWLGKGFGINLAEADGFVVGTDGAAPLRSPHNGHLTILARAGVPGIVLWIATCALWFGRLLRLFVIAKRRGDEMWANLFLWIGCYASGILINSSFDVALEGPMLGIWFWALFGIGIGVTMIYEDALRTRSAAVRD